MRKRSATLLCNPSLTGKSDFETDKFHPSKDCTSALRLSSDGKFQVFNVKDGSDPKPPAKGGVPATGSVASTESTAGPLCPAVLNMESMDSTNSHSIVAGDCFFKGDDNVGVLALSMKSCLCGQNR
jgi:hypothetical protein